jgi:ribonuclease HI
LSKLASARLFCDGASRGNPGPASAGAVVYDAETGEVAAEISRTLGIATNNVAEYQALLLGLEEALKLGARKVAVFADSQLLVRQLTGRYQVRHPDMRRLWGQARLLLGQFESWQASHVPREQNSVADRLANEALDAAAETRTGKTGRGAA